MAEAEISGGKTVAHIFLNLPRNWMYMNHTTDNFALFNYIQ